MVTHSAASTTRPSSVINQSQAIVTQLESLSRSFQICCFDSVVIIALPFFCLRIAQIRQARPIETVLTTSKTDERGNLVVLKAFLLHAPNHFQFFLRNGRSGKS